MGVGLQSGRNANWKDLEEHMSENLTGLKEAGKRNFTAVMKAEHKGLRENEENIRNWKKGGSYYLMAESSATLSPIATGKVENLPKYLINWVT